MADKCKKRLKVQIDTDLFRKRIRLMKAKKELYSKSSLSYFVLL